jgi:hypothetical protein
MYLVQGSSGWQLALLALLLQPSNIAGKVQGVALGVEEVGEGRTAGYMEASCLLDSCPEETRSSPE